MKILLLLIFLICPVSITSYTTYEDRMAEGWKYNAERNATIKTRWLSEAEARAYCERPVYMQSTATIGCFRVPTVEKPLCPFPTP